MRLHEFTELNSGDIRGLSTTYVRPWGPGTNYIVTELTTKFLETIQSVGLLVNDMRAQGYDGASVMSGHVSGVQTRIRQVNPNAVYVHCRPDVLNLCIVHASKLPLVRNIMDTVQEVTDYGLRITTLIHHRQERQEDNNIATTFQKIPHQHIGKWQCICHF